MVKRLTTRVVNNVPLHFSSHLITQSESKFDDLKYQVSVAHVASPHIQHINCENFAPHQIPLPILNIVAQVRARLRIQQVQLEQYFPFYSKLDFCADSSFFQLNRVRIHKASDFSPR